MILILTGLSAGALHVVSGPDHLAVVAPLVAEQPSKGFRLGFQWGLGHGLGVVILGILGMFVKGYIDVEAWSTNAEVLVGWLLIAVGLWSIWNNRSSAPKITEGHTHTDNRAHTDNRVVFGVGLFHGMAGTGHLLGVLPALVLSQTEAAIYLAMYFVSAIGSMMGFGWLLSKVVSTMGSLRTWTLLTAVGSIAVGLYWILVETA